MRPDLYQVFSHQPSIDLVDSSCWTRFTRPRVLRFDVTVQKRFRDKTTVAARGFAKVRRFAGVDAHVDLKAAGRQAEAKQMFNSSQLEAHTQEAQRAQRT